MLTNPFFWLGEIGLILSIISCVLLLHRFRDQHLIVIIPLWFVLIMSLAMLVRPAIYTLQHAIPAAPYLYRLAVGLLMASRAWYWRKESDAKEILTANRILRWGSVAGGLFLAYLAYKLRRNS